MNLLTYLLQAGLILTVLTIGYRLVLRRSMWFAVNRYLLWLNVGLAIGLPLVELPDFRPEPVRQFVQQTLPGWSAEKSLKPGSQDSPAFQTQETNLVAPVSQRKSLDWTTVAVWLYGLGVCLLTGQFLVQVTSLGRLIGRSERSWEGDIWLVNSQEVHSPFSFFHWVVLNLDGYDSDEADHILLHERVHCSQRHSLDMLLAEVVRIGFWFNPVAWWHGRLVQENLEYLVDRAVLNEGVDKKAYQYYLLKASLTDGSRVRSLANSFNQSQLKQRIGMMNQQGSGAGWRAYLFFGLVALASCLAFTPKTVSSRYVVANDSGVYGLITAVTTAQDLKAMKAIFAGKGLALNYNAEINTTGQIDRISLQITKDNQVVARTQKTMPPFIITAIRSEMISEFKIQAGSQATLLPRLLYEIWDREKTAVIHNGRVLNLKGSQTLRAGGKNGVTCEILTPGEATKRFGLAGQYGAIVIND